MILSNNASLSKLLAQKGPMLMRLQPRQFISNKQIGGVFAAAAISCPITGRAYELFLQNDPKQTIDD